jgi:hypothetical protein
LTANGKVVFRRRYHLLHLNSCNVGELGMRSSLLLCSEGCQLDAPACDAGLDAFLCPCRSFTCRKYVALTSQALRPLPPNCFQMDHASFSEMLSSGRNSACRASKDLPRVQASPPIVADALQAIGLSARPLHSVGSSRGCKKVTGKHHVSRCMQKDEAPAGIEPASPGSKPEVLADILRSHF